MRCPAETIPEAMARFCRRLDRGASPHAYPLPDPAVAGAPPDLHQAGGAAALEVSVPFCSARCTYCFAPTEIGHDAADMARYVDELAMELALAETALARYRFGSLNYGVGTPGLLPAKEFRRLHALLRPYLAAEASVTVATHPLAADSRRIGAWRACGIARVSLGVQSLDARVLALVNRPFSATHILTTLERLLAAGFADVNVDLLYGLPEQSLHSWQQTVAQIIRAGAPSVSLHRTIYIAETRERFRRIDALPPGDEHCRAMYDLAFERLNAAGYVQPRYGAMHFSRLPYAEGLDPHRRYFLEGKPVVGLGLGAHGRLEGYTYQNQRVRPAYRNELANGCLPVRTHQVVPREERPHQYAFEAWELGFLSARAYRAKFGESLEARFGVPLDALVGLEQIERVDDEYRLTRQGALHVSAIQDMFVLPQGWRSQAG